MAVVSFCVWQAAPRPAVSQQDPQISEMIRREVAIERDTRKLLDPGAVLSQGALFDYGGFVRFSLGSFDSFRDVDSDPYVQYIRPSRRTFRSYDARVWFSLTLDEIHKFYLRLRYDVMDFNANQSFGGDQVSGPNIDQAYYSVALEKLAEKYWGADWDTRAQLTVGEQHFYIGNGMTYSNVDDGIQVEASTGKWDVKALVSRTRGREKNIDRSDGVDENERYFAGLELAYAGIPQHRPYAYLLIQEDESDERTGVTLPDGRPATQRYDYKSRYLGGGATGEIIRNVGYRFEGVLEWGQSYGCLQHMKYDLETGEAVPDHDQSGSDQDNIRAYALNAGIDWYGDHKTKPRLSLDYYLASGDEHRLRVHDTEYGNRPGSTDRGFVGFGFVDTGFNYAPPFSNLRFLRADACFRPLPDVAPVKDLALGATYFVYHKHEKTGGLSTVDPTTKAGSMDEPGRFLGTEIDTYLNWRVLSDVTLSLRYALFMPGEVFSDRSARHFLFGTITYSF